MPGVIMMSDQTRTVLAMAYYVTTGRFPPEYGEAIAWCKQQGYVSDTQTLTPAGKSFWSGRTLPKEDSIR